MIEAPAAIAIAVTMVCLAAACLGLTVSLIHLRRRHRACRRTLSRVASERDAARKAERERVNQELALR